MEFVVFGVHKTQPEKAVVKYCGREVPSGCNSHWPRLSSSLCGLSAFGRMHLAENVSGLEKEFYIQVTRPKFQVLERLLADLPVTSSAVKLDEIAHRT